MSAPQFTGKTPPEMAQEMNRRFAQVLLVCSRAAREQSVSGFVFAEAATNALGQMLGVVVSSLPIEARNGVIAKVIEGIPHWVAAGEEVDLG